MTASPGKTVAKGSTFKRCTCPEGRKCPRLKDRHHGSWGFDLRVQTTTGVRTLRRTGFETQTAAKKKLDLVNDLIKLAKDDEKSRQKIGDMIFERSLHQGELPEAEDVRRRLGLRRENLGSSDTFGVSWRAWLAGKKKLRPSARKRLTETGEHWLLPVLEDIPYDRITGEHCAMVFERIEMFNEEIEAAKAEKRKPVLTGDVRKRARHVGGYAQHGVFAALREFLNYHLKVTHSIPFNPIYAVELEPIEVTPIKVWTPEQVAHFLEFHKDDRLIFMWRLALLRGFRRGELAGMGDDAFTPATASILVNVALIQIGTRLVWGRPKTRAGERTVGLDKGSVTAGKTHQSRRRRERLAAGPAWQDSGQMFTNEVGGALKPDWISRRFKAMAKEAGLPVIKLHAARHTAATLALQAKIDTKIMSETLGHSTTRITEDLYQHVSVQMQIGAAETVVALLPERPRGKAAKA
jgi:integrase